MKKREELEGMRIKNDNADRPPADAIRKGCRGAYRDILRRYHSRHFGGPWP